MARVERTLQLDASPDKVWALIGNFGDLSWHPGSAGTTLEERDGASVRSVAIAGGGTIVERMTGSSATSYSYETLNGPLPVANYQCTLKVEQRGAGSEVVWASTFEPSGAPEEVACGIIGNIYDAGLGALSQKF